MHLGLKYFKFYQKDPPQKYVDIEAKNIQNIKLLSFFIKLFFIVLSQKSTYTL